MCDCKICQRNRKFDEMIERVEDKEAKDFFMGLCNDFIDCQSDADYYELEYRATINYISKEYPEVKEQLRLMRKKEDFYECYASRINAG